MRFAQEWPGQIFSIYNVPSLKEKNMSILKKFFVFRWLYNLKVARNEKKQRERIRYSEKRWEMKLRGLKR